jgi:hypothetical protein
MVTFEVDLGKLTDWIGIAVNVLVFGTGLFVLWTGKQSVDALLRQLQSQASQQAYEAHKTVYMPVIQDPALAKMVWGPKADEYRLKLLASVMINHASRVYEEIKRGNIQHASLDSFRPDLTDLLSWPVIRDRWPEVRNFHHSEFVALADSCLQEIAGMESLSGEKSRT